MFRGFYTAASGMIAQQRRTELLTNNMANANTPGYKTDKSSLRAFPEMLLSRLDEYGKLAKIPSYTTVGSLNTGVYMQETIPNFVQGDLQETGNKTDLALLDIFVPGNQGANSKGTVFFAVQGPNGIRYTRNGNFAVNGLGYLTTADGLNVLDTNGNPIRVQTDNLKIDEQGRIFDNGEYVAQLGVSYAANPDSLVKEGDGLYRLDNGTLPNAFQVNNIRFRIQQGFTERSNVDAAQTMTDMLAAYRAYESNQKVLQAYDRSMDKAVNEVGRIN